MRCKVIILHNVWKTVVVDSHNVKNWFPADYDVNTGLTKSGEWRREFEESIPSVKSFKWNGVDIQQLNNQITANIRGKCHVRSSFELQCRYIAVSPEEIVAEYDDSFTKPQHNFAVYIVPCK